MLGLAEIERCTVVGGSDSLIGMLQKPYKGQADSALKIGATTGLLIRSRKRHLSHTLVSHMPGSEGRPTNYCDFCKIDCLTLHQFELKFCKSHIT